MLTGLCLERSERLGGSSGRLQGRGPGQPTVPAGQASRFQLCAAELTHWLVVQVGDYTLQLNNYSSKSPYRHMADHCPSEPPRYTKPANC